MQFFCSNPRRTGSGADQGPALSAYNNFTPSRARQPEIGLPGVQTSNPQPLNRSSDGSLGARGPVWACLIMLHGFPSCLMSMMVDVSVVGWPVHHAQHRYAAGVEETPDEKPGQS